MCFEQKQNLVKALTSKINEIPREALDAAHSKVVILLL